MKLGVLICASIVGSLLGTTAIANAYPGHDEDKAESHKKERGEHRKEHGRSSVQHSDNHHGNKPEHLREVVRHEPEHHAQPREAWQGHRAQHWAHEHHSWRERGGYHGYRIPEARFHEHFGRGHWFYMHSAPIIVVEGRPRFHYGGFWFSVVDPWPEYWASNWYETDEVYVDYVNDGYYMFNRRHPGVAIAVNVSF